MTTFRSRLLVATIITGLLFWLVNGLSPPLSNEQLQGPPGRFLMPFALIALCVLTFGGFLATIWCVFSWAGKSSASSPVAQSKRRALPLLAPVAIVWTGEMAHLLWAEIAHGGSVALWIPFTLSVLAAFGIAFDVLVGSYEADRNGE